MSKFNEVLNYRSSCGRQFELLEGEKLAIDGLDFTSTWGSRASYVMFVTNMRIIIKQAVISHNRRAIESAFHADVRYIFHDDINTVKFTQRPGVASNSIVIDGTFRDYSVKEKTGDDWECGHLRIGFGGLEYSSNEEFYQGFTRTFKALSEEYGFGFYCNGSNQSFSNISKDEAHVKQKEITKNRFAAYGISAALIAALLGFAINLENQEKATSTATNNAAREEVYSGGTAPNRTNTQVTQEQPQFTIQSRTVPSTCWTSAFAGSDGSKLNSYDCDVRSLTTSAGLMIFVNWSDGVESQFVIRDDKTATIYGDGSTAGINAEWWEYTHNGVEMISIQSEKGAQSWISINDALDANPTG